LTTSQEATIRSYINRIGNSNLQLVVVEVKESQTVELSMTMARAEL